MTTHAYQIVLRVHQVPERVDQGRLDRAVQVAIEHSGAKDALSAAIEGSLGDAFPFVTLEVEALRTAVPGSPAA